MSSTYNQRFDEVFPIPANFPTTKAESLKAFSKAITSNLVGGIGYFYGRSIVDEKFSYEWDQDEDRSEDTEKKGAHMTDPRGLLTATPSRSFFPRGFYWFVSILFPYAVCVTCDTGTRASICSILANGTTT